MGILKKYFDQTGKPEGTLGKIMIASMNTGHSSLSDWGLSFLKDQKYTNIVDLGCGGGRSIEKMLHIYPEAKVTGIDYSELSVESSRKRNAEAIRSGRCAVFQDDVSKLHLEKNSYDLATAFETIYFWPGLEHCFGNVFNILKPDGIFMIVLESDGTDKAGKKFENMINGMKLYTVPEIDAALKTAGFHDIQNHTHTDKDHWAVILARK